jgi:uncharacterized repeat protein (TIGR03803 family)
MKKLVSELFPKAMMPQEAARKPMQRRGFTIALSLLFAICAVALNLAPKAWAGDTVLYNFAGPPGDGAYSIGTPVNDKYGNLYGTTAQGGLHGYGTVFVLCAPGATAPDLYPCTTALSNWTEFVLYNFKGPISGDGANPRGTLIFNGLYGGRAFTLYGTTYNGGKLQTCPVKGTLGGCGTVFEVCAPSNFGGCGGVNAWKEKVLHRFTGGKDGSHPFGGVITDKASDLFGTTVYGGAFGTCYIGSTNSFCGTVFKLKGGSPWNFPETILHRFKGAPGDGANPYDALCCNTIFAVPYLYGTTVNGGTSSVGTVFKVKNSAAHPETVLYNFAGSPDGANPYADVIFDASGNLYSTTSAGGANSAGTVFELLGPSLTSESVLYNFCPIAGCADGAIPYAGLMFDGVGNLYGTTYSGGTGCGGTCGTVFELIPSWTETVLYSFIGGGTDGSNPFAGVIYDPPAGSGVLYGVTRLSGSSSYGIAYSVP